MAFHALFLKHVTWRDLDGPSKIGCIRLNRNDSKLEILLESLIEELRRDPMVTPNLSYKLRCSLIL